MSKAHVPPHTIVRPMACKFILIDGHYYNLGRATRLHRGICLGGGHQYHHSPSHGKIAFANTGAFTKRPVSSLFPRYTFNKLTLP